MSSRKNPVQRLTILNSAGISLFHRSFTQEDTFDEHLFSGFTSAILTFSKEMGNDLNSISMKGLDLYFQPLDHMILVLGIDNSYSDKDSITNIFNQISELEEVEKMEEKARSGVLEVPQELDTKLMDILSKFGDTSISDQSYFDDIDNSISEKLKSYYDGNIKAKDLAIQFIGQDIEQSEADKKLETTNMIINLLESSNIDKSARKNLAKLLSEMQKRSNRAAAKANKALF